MTLRDAVASGDERRALEAMRDSLAAHMEVAESSVVAQVAARLQAVLQRLAELGPAETPRSALDELANRRQGRRSAS